MFTRNLRYTLTAALLVASSICGIADDSVSTIKAPKITDARLGSMRYGGESIVYGVKRMKQGDQSRGKKLADELSKLRSRMQRMNGVDAEQVKLLNQYFTKIEQAIQSKTTQTITLPKTSPKNPPRTKLIPKPAQSTQPIGTKGVRPLPIQSQTASKHDVTDATSAKISNADGLKFANLVQSKYSSGGTVPLPKIRYLMQDGKLEKAEVDKTINALKHYRSEVAKDLPVLKRVVTDTGQGEYWLRWIGGEQMKAYQQEIRILQSALDSKITRAAQDVANRIQLDTKKHSFQFRGDAAKKTLERFENAIGLIDQASRLEKPLGLDGRWSGKKTEFAKNTATYRSMVEQVGGGTSTQLPKEIVNPELRKIAEAVLRKEKYGVGKWERLIVNSKLMPRDRIEHKAFNGKLETIVRKWEEYQVTTVEKAKDGKHYLYYNMIAKFSRAPQTTPVGEWILTKRFKGNAIAKKNLK